MRFRSPSSIALVSLVAVLTVLVSGLGVAPAGAACASPTSRALGGSVQGEDGRYVYAFIGIDLEDKYGNKIGLNGCRAGGEYSATVSVNKLELTGEGTTDGDGLTKSWRVGGLPANAVSAWIEVYPKTKNPYGATDVSRYGRSLRRRIPLPTTNLGLKLPLNCGFTENGVVGDNGEIAVQLRSNGVGVSANRVVAWSLTAHSPGRILGWGMANVADGAPYRIKALSPDQRYYAWVTKDGKTKKILDVPVDGCRTTPLVVEMSATAGIFSGTDTVGVRRGTTYLLRNTNSTGSSDFTFTKGRSTDRAVFGDWNMDGKDTIGLRRGDSWLLFNKNTATTPAQQFRFGKSTDTKLLIGDWDGDKRDDVGVRRGNTFYLRTTHSTGAAQIKFSWGLSSDKVVVGDWNGDGKDSIGLRRGDTFILRNRLSSGTPDRKFRFGSSSDRPVAGDWDGDMVDTVGVRRGNQLLFRNWNSGGSPSITMSYGKSTDIFLYGDFDNRSY